MEPSSPSTLSRWLRRAAIALAALFAVLAALFVSIGPSVEESNRPTAGDVAAVREAWGQLERGRGSGKAMPVRIDDRMLRGLAALASDAAGSGRFEGRVADGVLSGRASFALPAGLWINASATVAGEHEGFPAVRLKVGRVTFPLAAGRWAADIGGWVLSRRGATVPPLDEVVRRFAVHDTDVLAEVVLPERTGILTELIATGGGGLDRQAVGKIYCELAAGQQERPASDLAEMARRTFEPVRADPTRANTRAAFVALSLLVVGKEARILVPDADELERACPRPAGQLRLQQRADLAKHWTLSAAIAAVLGEKASASIGEWKELDDSLGKGSGFSFVDIAADRAGVRTALRALDPATAEQTIDQLAQASEESLLPETLLRGPEGLSEQSFVDRYGSLDRDRYKQAIVAIDRELAAR